MDNSSRIQKYEELYKQLLWRGDVLHENNKKRIRRGLISLIVLPVVLGFIRWITDSDKVVFLIIWILIMFAICAYLISIEYLDSAIESTLRNVTDNEAEFDGLLPTLDLHERIRERIAERRAERLEAVETIAKEELIEEEETEALEDALDQIEELREAEAAIEELRETAPPEIITALKEAFDRESADAETEDAAEDVHSSEEGEQ